jgi:hypothetical protein
MNLRNSLWLSFCAGFFACIANGVTPVEQPVREAMLDFNAAVPPLCRNVVAEVNKNVQIDGRIRGKFLETMKTMLSNLDAEHIPKLKRAAAGQLTGKETAIALMRLLRDLIDTRREIDAFLIDCMANNVKPSPNLLAVAHELREEEEYYNYRFGIEIELQLQRPMLDSKKKP